MIGVRSETPAGVVTVAEGLALVSLVGLGLIVAFDLNLVILASIHRLLIGGRCLGSILVVGRVGRGVLVRARVGVAVGGSWVGCRRRACRGCVRSWCEVSA